MSEPMSAARLDAIRAYVEALGDYNITRRDHIIVDLLAEVERLRRNHE